VTVVVNALTGIGAIIVGDLGETAGRFLLTTLTLSALGLCCLLCVLGWDAGRLSFIPSFGLTLSIVGFVLVIAGIWAEPADDDFWRLTGTLTILGMASAYGCLVSLANLVRSEFLKYTAVAAAYGFGAMIIIAIWGGDDSSPYGEMFGIVAIILLASSLLVPVVQRFEGLRTTPNPVFEPPPGPPPSPAPGPVVTVSSDTPFCPGCGAPVTMFLPNLSCDRCEGRYRVEVVSPPRRRSRAAVNGRPPAESDGQVRLPRS
jgi:hypothetical protein